MPQTKLFKRIKDVVEDEKNIPYNTLKDFTGQDGAVKVVNVKFLLKYEVMSKFLMFITTLSENDTIAQTRMVYIDLDSPYYEKNISTLFRGDIHTMFIDCMDEYKEVIGENRSSVFYQSYLERTAGKIIKEEIEYKEEVSAGDFPKSAYE